MLSYSCSSSATSRASSTFCAPRTGPRSAIKRPWSKLCSTLPSQALVHQQAFKAGIYGGAYCHSPSRRAAVPCSASLMVKEASTGVEFPLVQNYWFGDVYRSMGASSRAKKIAFISVKVYAITLYVEAEKAARELGLRKRGGFFDDDSDDDYALALVDGAFCKVLQVEMVRQVDGPTFAEALNKYLEPRMRLMGDMSSLDKFKEFFADKSIEKGTSVLLMWRQPDSLEVALATDKSADCSGVVPGLVLQSPGLCRALFELYLGSSCVIPEAKTEWVKGTKALLESEEIRRDTKKSGA